MRVRPSFVVTVAGSVALASCVLDFDEVGPRGAGNAAGAGAGATSSGGNGPGGSGGQPSGGGEVGGATATHDCTSQPSACVIPPADLFVLAETCDQPLFIGGLGDGPAAIDLPLVACDCACDGSCKLTVGRYATNLCALDVTSFLLFDGQCTDDLAPNVFDPSNFHSPISASFECTPTGAKPVDALDRAFKRPVVGCDFASTGCASGSECLSTIAPVCMFEPEGGCPTGFKSAVKVLSVAEVPETFCDCSCEKGDEDACPTVLRGGNVCEGTTTIDCDKAQKLKYVGEGECTVEEALETDGLVSTKLCCDKSPPPT